MQFISDSSLLNPISEQPTEAESLQFNYDDISNEINPNMEKITELAKIFTVKHERNRDFWTFEVKLTDDFKKSVDSILKDSSLRDEKSHRTEFHLPFQKNFERLFHRYLETCYRPKSRNIKESSMEKIKYRQLNSYLSGEKSLEGQSCRAFRELLIEFVLNFNISHWKFREYGAKFLSKLRLSSFQMVFLTFQEVSRNDEYHFKYIQIIESWPLAKIQCFL